MEFLYKKRKLYIVIRFYNKYKGVNMRRKVIQIANSTQLISLPRKWAKSRGIKKGDELEVNEKGNSIVISAEKKDEVRKAIVDMSKLGTYIERFFHAFYKAGYDELLVNYSIPEQLDQIQRILGTTTIGYEIVDQKANSCLIKAVAESSESEFNPMLRRTFLLLEIVNNKYTGFCRRILNKGGYDPTKVSLVYCTVEELEKIADEFKYVCNYILKNKDKIKIDKKIKKILKKLAELYNGCYQLYYSFDIKKASELFMERKRLVEEITPLFENKKYSARILHHLLTTTQKIANIISFELIISLDKITAQ
jgi:phosphate uptake regulator